jgi:predicted alpha/beta hydrolase family esterase
MMLREPHTIVIVPGLRGHVDEHWQTLLAVELDHVRVVESYDRDKRDLVGRVADLDHVIQDAGTPVTLVAHSAGVLTTVHWATRHVADIRGALLATPPPLVEELPAEYPTLAELRENGWLPIPLTRLAFPSIVAASTNDALGPVESVRALADAWGSRFVDVGPVGHLNPAAGYGEWPDARSLLGLLAGTQPTTPLGWMPPHSRPDTTTRTV